MSSYHLNNRFRDIFFILYHLTLLPVALLVYSCQRLHYTKVYKKKKCASCTLRYLFLDF
jgi:hypothetical protein